MGQPKSFICPALYHANKKTEQLDNQGHLILPPEIVRQYGLVSGASGRLDQTENGITFSRSTASLTQVYVEATNTCNLDCRTCTRNVWDEPLGNLSRETFSSILQGIQSFSPLSTVFFGGFGELLAHPNILEMIAAARQLGAQVELITNGILLTEAVAIRLIKLGLYRL